MNEQQVWVQNQKWLRTEKGVWISRDLIEYLEICKENEESYSIVVRTSAASHVLKDAFSDYEQAQMHLDKLQLFYELKAVSQSLASGEE